MARVNRQWVVNGRPVGRPLEDGDFLFKEAPVAEPDKGEVLVRVLSLGFEPAIKGWMASKNAPISEIGQVIYSTGVGQVVQSAHPAFAEGDMVVGPLGWQDYALVSGRALDKIENDELLTANLGAAGISGFTAYFGLQKIGRPFPGDVVVVTSAAGAVGSVASQLAKLAGCTVIGIAGGPEKCAWLTGELGLDGAIDYKSQDIASALEELTPKGIDLIFDNVGGDQLDAMLGKLSYQARIVLCGGISRYEKSDPTGPANYFNLIPAHATMTGFLAGTYSSEFPQARARLKNWLREGKMRHKEDIVDGLEAGPATLMRLFVGANFGKQILKVADPA